MDLKAYQRDCLLGTLSGLLMLAGDLCLSVVPYTAPTMCGTLPTRSSMSGICSTRSCWPATRRSGRSW